MSLERDEFSGRLEAALRKCRTEANRVLAEQDGRSAFSQPAAPGTSRSSSSSDSATASVLVESEAFRLRLDIELSKLRGVRGPVSGAPAMRSGPSPVMPAPSFAKAGPHPEPLAAAPRAAAAIAGRPPTDGKGAVAAGPSSPAPTGAAADADLHSLTTAWPALSPIVREAVMRIVRASQPK